MKGQFRRISVAGSLMLMGVLFSFPNIQSHVSSSTTWQTGDVFVGVSNGTYQVYDNAGNFKESITDGMGGFTTGCAFNPTLDRLYTTNFGNTKVVVYDNESPHAIVQIIDTGATSPNGHSESVVFDAAGDFFVGHPDSNRLLHKYDPSGSLLTTFSPAFDSRGIDWIDLAINQATMFYTSEGRAVQRFDVAGNLQLTNFAALPGSGEAFALRLLPPGDGSGGLLVADGSNIKRLDGSGAVVQTYDIAGENTWFSLNLDPNGTSFWAGNFGTSNFYRFNIDIGSLEVGPINTGTGPFTVFGICVRGEPTAAIIIEVPVDIKPQSCPNPLNTKDNGVLPVAILGTGDFDVTKIDIATVRLAGVAPLRSTFEDVATPFSPFTGKENCFTDCTTAGPDSFVDLTLKFDAQMIVNALGAVSDGQCLVVELTGKLKEEFGGIPIKGEDVLLIRKKN